MTFEMGAGGTSYIDLGLATSILNRRFYRQGLNWAVTGMTIYSSGANKTVRVATLQKNWCTSNAWEKGFRLWRKMNDQVLDTEPSIEGRFADYKIFMDNSHLTNFINEGFQSDTGISAGKTLLPVVINPASGGSILPDRTNAEWNYSEYMIPDPASGVATPHNIFMNGGTTATAVGLISGYGLSRSRPQVNDPNVPITSADSWMNELFDLGGNDPEIRDNIVDENNQAPYALQGAGSAIERYPGGETNLAGLQLVSPPITSSAGTDYSGRVNIPGFTAPCGLIYIKNDGPVTVQVHLSPGTHKGYAAEPMQEM